MNVKTAKKNFSIEKRSNNTVFGLLTKMLNTGMFMTHNGANGTKTLDYCH